MTSISNNINNVINNNNNNINNNYYIIIDVNLKLGGIIHLRVESAIFKNISMMITIMVF